MSDNEIDTDALGGCLVLLVIILVPMFVLAIFFPATRGGEFVNPIVRLWESQLGIPMPSYNVGPIILKAFFLLLVTAAACLCGISIAKFINRLSPDFSADLQTWGAIASIIGLIIGILSLIK